MRYVALGAQPQAVFGLLGPAFGLGFGASARLRLPSFEVEVAGFSLLSRSIGMSPGHVEVQLAAGSAGACKYLLREKPAELALCAALLAGRFAGEGFGYRVDRAQRSLWLGAAASTQMTLEVSQHFALRAALSLVLPLRQSAVTVENVGRAYQPSPLAAIFALGPELRFR